MTQDREQLRHTAIHEAGHFVAATRYGVIVYQLSIEPNRESESIGRCSDEGSDWTREQGQQQAIIYCAGYAALIAQGFPPEIAELGCGPDFDEAEQIINLWDLPSLEECKAAAVDLLRQESNQKAVSVIADELLTEKNLNVQLADVLIEHSDGHCTDAELARFRALFIAPKTPQPDRDQLTTTPVQEAHR